MSILAEAKPHKASRAPLVVIYGRPGIGKTYFACRAPNPVVLRTEDGLGKETADTFPMIEFFGGLMNYLQALQNEKHNYKTVIIDSLSSLEPIIWKDLCIKHHTQSIEQVMGGYGKGYGEATKWFGMMVKECFKLTEMGITVIMIAHAQQKATTDPEVDLTYDENQIKLQKGAFALLYEQADVIGYAHKPLYVKAKDKGDLSAKNKVKARGDEQLRLIGSPGTIAKNRLGMPEMIDFKWDVFAQYVPFYNQTTNPNNS